MRKPPRRYVLGLNEDGKSCVHPTLSGDLPPTPPGEPDGYEGPVWAIPNEVWGVSSLPPDLENDEDIARLPYEHDPVRGGVKFRFVEIPPHDKNHPAAQGAGTVLVASETLDVVVMLEGEVRLLLESGHVDLVAGDFLVMRGQKHNWYNRSGRSAFLAGLLIGAQKPGP